MKALAPQLKPLLAEEIAKAFLAVPCSAERQERWL
jgi:hypothetical protein